MPGHIISLIMAYIFNAVTHIANDIRIMAFKFFNLAGEHYPSSFFSNANKVCVHIKLDFYFLLYVLTSNLCAQIVIIMISNVIHIVIILIIINLSYMGLA